MTRVIVVFDNLRQIKNVLDRVSSICGNQPDVVIYKKEPAAIRFLKSGICKVEYIFVSWRQLSKNRQLNANLFTCEKRDDVVVITGQQFDIFLDLIHSCQTKKKLLSTALIDKVLSVFFQQVQVNRFAIKCQQFLYLQHLLLFAH